MSCSVSAARRRVVDDGERAQVLLADRQHPAVVVAALALDGRGVAGQRRGLLRPDRCELLEVDDQIAAAASAAAAARLALGQQLADRHAVEVGQLGQPLHGHGAVAALVRADDDGLPAALALLLDAVQGQALLGADGAQPGARAPWRSRVIGALSDVGPVGPGCGVGLTTGSTGRCPRSRVAVTVQLPASQPRRCDY